MRQPERPYLTGFGVVWLGYVTALLKAVNVENAVNTFSHKHKAPRTTGGCEAIEILHSFVIGSDDLWGRPCRKGVCLS